jgi:hypothetical protein
LRKEVVVVVVTLHVTPRVAFAQGRWCHVIADSPLNARVGGGGARSPPTCVCKQARVLVVACETGRCWWLVVVRKKISRATPWQQGVGAPPLVVRPPFHLLLTYPC